MFGGVVKEPLPDVTPTYLTGNVLAKLRQCDDVAMTVNLSLFIANVVNISCCVAGLAKLWANGVSESNGRDLDSFAFRSRPSASDTFVPAIGRY